MWTNLPRRFELSKITISWILPIPSPSNVREGSSINRFMASSASAFILGELRGNDFANNPCGESLKSPSPLFSAFLYCFDHFAASVSAHSANVNKPFGKSPPPPAPPAPPVPPAPPTPPLPMADNNNCIRLSGTRSGLPLKLPIPLPGMNL